MRKGDPGVQDVWFAIALFTILPAASQFGFWVGRRVARERHAAAKSHAGNWETAVLGLAGLLIAFTFSMASDRLDQRKHIMVQESNDIGTTYLRSRLLEAVSGEELRALLRQYVDARIALEDAGGDRARVQEVLRASASLEEQIWSRVAAAGRAHLDSEMISLLVQSTNEMIDSAAEHTFALEHPVPPTVFLLLIIVTAVAMGSIGLSCGLEGTRLAFGMLVMPLLLAAVIAMVFDLAHPRIGIVKVRDQGLIRLKESFGTPPPGPESRPR